MVFEFMDCAQEGNIAKCSEFNETPVLQFYPVRDSKAVRGSPTRLDFQENVDNLISQVEKQLEKTHTRGIFQPNFGLLNLDEPISGIFPDIRELNHIALVPQTIGSDICRDIIFGLLPLHEVAVRIVPDKRWFEKNKVQFRDDWIVIVIRGPFVNANDTVLLKPKTLSSKGYIDAISEYLNNNHYYVRDFELSDKSDIDIPALQQNIIFSELRKPKFRVYRADLEKAIEKILTQDTLRENFLEGKKLLVLKNIVTLLHHFNPLSATGNGTLIINRFYEALADPKRNNTLGPKVMSHQFEKIIGNNSFDAKNYVRCASSIPNLRHGFTCALWLLFHYLTVEVANNLGK